MTDHQHLQRHIRGREIRGVPRHLLSHRHIEATADNVSELAVAPIYPACGRAATDSGTEQQTESGGGQLEALVKQREAASEKWLADYAESINSRHYVTSALAFKTFAPNGKESLQDIFAKFSGAPE